MAGKRVLIIFAVIIAAAAGGLAFPFLSTLHINVPPPNTTMWQMGKGSQYLPHMSYKIDYNGTPYSADIAYKSADLFSLLLTHDAKTDIDQTVNASQVYLFKGESSKTDPYFEMLDNTIFSMNWYATSPKYLAVGASWGDVYIGSIHEHMRVRSCGKVDLPFGSLDAQVLSYREIDGSNNTVWIVDNLPLPVMAKYYLPDQNLHYSFQMVSLDAKSTPFKPCPGQP
ncbi:MAG: hypothetical protein KGI33_05350 [Thaumarchaeota archaeon]|nr:hypothetical protein [Nitrososphaerota archaeon]